MKFATVLSKLGIFCIKSQFILKGEKCPFPNYEHSSDKNAELNSTGTPQTRISVDLPTAKTTAGSREWIKSFSFSMAVTGSKQI